MALPDNPTSLSLIAEGMRRALGRTATSGEQARALDEWVEEIKNEVWFTSTTHELLELTKFQVITEGTQRYAVPSDYESLHSLIVLDGSPRDTARAGANNTITLASVDSEGSAGRIGKEIILISGTGSGQRRTITGYNTDTKVATVDSNWVTNPDSATGYVIVFEYANIDIEDQHSFNKYIQRTYRGRPEHAGVFGNEIYLRPVPEKSYGLLTNYWVNIQQLDKNSSAYTIMLRKWRALFVEGIYIKTLQDEDDARYAQELPVYTGMLSIITGKSAQMGQIKPQI